MIPRFCEAKHVTQAYTTEDVSRIVKDAVNNCKGKRCEGGGGATCEQPANGR